MELINGAPGEMLSVLKSPQMTEKTTFSSASAVRVLNDPNSVWTSFIDLQKVGNWYLKKAMTCPKIG